VINLQRRFAIIGHRAPSTGNIFLNDLSGLSGRIDVLARAINSTLFLSHGIRKDSQIILHLMGGEGSSRRVLFDGSTLAGVRPDERSIAGHIRSLVKLRLPPIGTWIRVSAGIYHSGGDIETTLQEWSRDEVNILVLDKQGIELDEITLVDTDVGFILSDDTPFSDKENKSLIEFKRINVGEKWLQGHSCITIVHHIIDSNILD
jgi:tRNA (pseudouridine54-N1)-methyltransferase|tara:strand:- start:1452 stop:2063 length:612 start_codon:yes stop_codon:yes gene_type:complete